MRQLDVLLQYPPHKQHSLIKMGQMGFLQNKNQPTWSPPILEQRRQLYLINRESGVISEAYDELKRSNSSIDKEQGNSFLMMKDAGAIECFPQENYHSITYWSEKTNRKYFHWWKFYWMEWWTPEDFTTFLISMTARSGRSWTPVCLSTYSALL